jgi:hypothetical protein
MRLLGRMGSNTSTCPKAKPEIPVGKHRDGPTKTIAVDRQLRLSRLTNDIVMRARETTNPKRGHGDEMSQLGVYWGLGVYRGMDDAFARQPDIRGRLEK